MAHPRSTHSKLSKHSERKGDIFLAAAKVYIEGNSTGFEFSAQRYNTGNCFH